jgi:hypothetical protein
MLTIKRKPASVGEILTLEFMAPMGLTQGAVAKAMGMQRKHVSELCNAIAPERIRYVNHSPGGTSPLNLSDDPAAGIAG